MFLAVVVDFTMGLVSPTLVLIGYGIRRHTIRSVGDAVLLAILGENDDFNIERIDFSRADDAIEAYFTIMNAVSATGGVET